MKFSEFYNLNNIQLRKNYMKRQKHFFKTNFNEYCVYVYTAYSKNFWLHDNYKTNIIFKKD